MAVMATVGPLLEPGGLTASVAVAPTVAEVTVDGFALAEYEAAFGCLYRRAYDVAYKLLGYRAEAEDVAQEALARAYVHWPKVHGYAEPWVVRVAANLAIGSWRKNRRLTRLGDAETIDLRTSNANTAERLELRRALTTLSKRQREVVVLRHLAGFSERETAEVLGCSNGTVKQHSSRGLSALRHLLNEDDLPDDDLREDGAAEPRDGGTGGVARVDGVAREDGVARVNGVARAGLPRATPPNQTLSPRTGSTSSLPSGAESKRGW